MITQQQVSQYREEGWLVVPELLNDLMRQRMKDALAQWVEQSRKVSSHTDVFDLERGHTAAEPRLRRIKQPHRNHPVFEEFIRSKPMLEVLAALLGPGLRLQNSKLNLKSPRFGSPVEWHQDWAFYPATNDDILAVGVMLDDTSLENGAMLVVPGSHKGPTYDHHDADGRFCGALDPNTPGLNLDRAVPIVGRAGSVSFHHVRAVHGSAQNRSTMSRNFLLYEVSASDAFPLMGVPNFEEFNSLLLQGEPTIVPRFRDAPVRMPLPPALNQGSIYENQSSSGKRFFEQVEVPQQAAST
ncbi:phytanoyl-CoA dioxygenase family protein [Herbaspirillum sp. LeCh32-8]|uniref:phytanoyl-CoA dioxygenase family protein n=1 Tax=Herbaspirillum sp. LeCh32-8 TaxID=2821356 RepID=UPI001AE72995|nr:phytanoyl-CoA dioxygenase family protein [Herbaspirillum sp. LeCh32-8]MBP0596837.1 phytanoyl-CoA dioxygenase family protein [Herbaspirillum sp. LeCh32-8]